MQSFAVSRFLLHVIGLLDCAKSWRKIKMEDDFKMDLYFLCYFSRAHYNALNFIFFNLNLVEATQCLLIILQQVSVLQKLMVFWAHKDELIKLLEAAFHNFQVYINLIFFLIIYHISS